MVIRQRKTNVRGLRQIKQREVRSNAVPIDAFRHGPRMEPADIAREYKKYTWPAGAATLHTRKE